MVPDIKEVAMRTYRFVSILATAALASCLGLGSASAMTSNATPDGSDHPSVVALVVVKGGWASMYCSGTLIAPTVVLTASHCNAIVTEDWFMTAGYSLGVTNAPTLNVDASGSWFPFDGTGDQSAVQDGGVVTNTLYRGGYRDDVSAQIISHPLDGWDLHGVVDLPPVGLLDQLEKTKTLRSTTSLVLGYGSEAKTIPAANAQAFPNSDERRSAELGTTAIDKQWIHQSQNVAQGQAGACYGDSGGPTLMNVGTKTYLVAVTSTGDGPCFATNVASRVDNESAWTLLHSLGLS
jgi:hypothetical protein